MGRNDIGFVIAGGLHFDQHLVRQADDSRTGLADKAFTIVRSVLTIVKVASNALMATVRTVPVSTVVKVATVLSVLITAKVVIVHIVPASTVVKVVAIVITTVVAAIVRDLTMIVRRVAIVRVRVPVITIRMLSIASRSRLSTRNSLLIRTNRFV